MSKLNESNMNQNRTKQSSTPNIRWMLVGYDLTVYAVVAIVLLVLYGGMDKLSTTGIIQQICLSVLCIFATRLIGKVYGQVWRYGGIQCYIRLLFTDSIAFIAYLCLELLLPVQKITFARMLSLVSLNLLCALVLRMMYRYAYKCGNQESISGKILSILKKKKVHVTFFMTGGWIEKYPDDVKAIQKAGHELGNHSENHKQMSTLSSEQCKEEIMKVHERVKKLTGTSMKVFRPPYGDYNDTLIQTVNACGYKPIQWDVDTLDTETNTFLF